MFWIFLALCGLAFTFMKLGALSVLTKVLLVALLATLAVLSGGVLYLLLRKLLSGRTS